jgi:RNA polymerase sigma factor (sigma-70 family)
MTAATTTDDQDRDDMVRLAAGHGAALEDLMGRHAERLFHYLLRVLQNETEAGDLAQETFVRVYQNRARFKLDSKFSTWLYTIGTNLARDAQRRRARHSHVSLNAGREDSGQDFNEVLPDPGPNPGEKLGFEERIDAVRKAVAALPEDLRTPLVLAEYEDKSQAEIATILDCTAKAVEMRIYRARLELRKSLRELLPLGR